MPTTPNAWLVTSVALLAAAAGGLLLLPLARAIPGRRYRQWTEDAEATLAEPSALQPASGGAGRFVVCLASAVAIVPLLVALKRHWRRKILFSSTALPDLPQLGSPARRKYGTAVICGGRFVHADLASYSHRCVFLVSPV